jgi:hypothetical protein
LDVPGSYSVARKWKLIRPERWDGKDAAGRIAHFETMSMAERRYAQSVAQEELAANFANAETKNLCFVLR